MVRVLRSLLPTCFFLMFTFKKAKITIKILSEKYNIFEERTKIYLFNLGTL